MSQNQTDIEQGEESQQEQIPAFKFPFSPETYAPKGQEGQPHDPARSKTDRHHQGRIYHRRGSHRVLGKR